MKPELIAPGGSLDKIAYAFHFGADAVYAGAPDFSLRSRLNEFGEKKLAEAVKLARAKKKKIYFTLNIFAHERHLTKIKKHIAFVVKARPDAVIVSDPGIIGLLKKSKEFRRSGIKIHLSTQANTTNSEAVKFWKNQGISRVILARETTLSEIRKIKKSCPGMELEYFVHGAMCVSYSGRCLLSRWFTGRSANLGDCAQPCRWKYGLAKEFRKRRGSPEEKPKPQSCDVMQSMADCFRESGSKEVTVEEDEHGTYLFNSKDLCLIEHLEKLANAGVSAFKIEGRTKSVYYVATVVKAYKQALGTLEKRNKRILREAIRQSKKELGKIANRGYSTGFLFGKENWEIETGKSHVPVSWQFVGEILGEKKDFLVAKIHNVLGVGEKIEIVTPEGVFWDKVGEIRKENGETAKSAHGGSKNMYLLKLGKKYDPMSLLRKKI